MGRKQKHPEHANHERWLVSYADFITLLFAFFVVMFAVSQVDTNKVGRFTDSVERATRWGIFDKASSRGPVTGKGLSKGSRSSGEGTGSVGSSVGASTPVQGGREGNGGLGALRGQVERQFRAAILAGRIEVSQSEDGVIIRLREAGFFAPGSDTLEDQSREELADIGRWLRRSPNPIQIEGHTDALPMRGGRFRSNWELGAARSARVLEVLVEAGVNERRLSVASYGPLRPIAGNETEAGRRKNRRVDLVVRARPSEPLPPSAPVRRAETAKAPGHASDG